MLNNWRLRFVDRALQTNISMIGRWQTGNSRGLPVESGLLGTIEGDKACIRDRDHQLHLDVFNTEKSLWAEEVLAAEREFAHSWGSPGALPAAIGVIYSQEIGVP